MSTTTRIPALLTANARHTAPAPDVFQYVIGVDECGAPILAPDAPIPCENDMAPVSVVGTGGHLTYIPLREALAQKDLGILKRVGAITFELTDHAKAMKGPGISPAVARRRRVIAENLR